MASISKRLTAAGESLATTFATALVTHLLKVAAPDGGPATQVSAGSR
ncbi:MAG: hypothetical protein QOI95_2523 [Acidimicrobiaceae bacterium]|jgi:hypothetical protein